MNKNRVRMGIIGCGRLGRTHADCIQQLDDVELTAYCDIVESQAVAMLASYGGDYATTDADKLLNDSSLDAVYITSLHDSHAEYCVRALMAGKHVLVEKPLAMNAEDCRRIGEAVRRSGKKLFMAYKMRMYDMIGKAKELIPVPVMISMQMMDNRWGDGIWPNDPVKGGGNVISQGCHSTDILRYVAGGNPLEVYAVGGNYYQPTGVIDNLTAVFRFDNGVGANWIQGDCSCPSLPSKFFMQIFAENKSITITDRLTTLIYKEAGQEEKIFKGSESGFMEENKAFLRCIREDIPPLIDHEDGLYATLMVLQAIESLKSGKPEPIAAIVEQAMSAPECSVTDEMLNLA